MNLNIKRIYSIWMPVWIPQAVFTQALCFPWGSLVLVIVHSVFRKSLFPVSSISISHLRTHELLTTHWRHIKCQDCYTQSSPNERTYIHNKHNFSVPSKLIKFWGQLCSCFKKKQSWPSVGNRKKRLCHLTVNIHVICTMV